MFTLTLAQRRLMKRALTGPVERPETANKWWDEMVSRLWADGLVTVDRYLEDSSMRTWVCLTDAGYNATVKAPRVGRPHTRTLSYGEMTPEQQARVRQMHGWGEFAPKADPDEE